ncbi:hypothetical protein Q3G72_016075 [Acer saccharum]|nr:hypothetical protein Q3G72_016075 [Acer saccharum]
MSDQHNVYATFPSRALHRQQNQMGPMANIFKSLASKHNVAGFIVGYPSRTGKEDNDGALVTKFIDDLCKTGILKGIKYTYWDDNIASMHSEYIYAYLVDFWSAHMALPLDISKETVENLAAVPILQGYLDCSKILMSG